MPRVSTSEKIRRDARVVADRARGLTWRTIAERHDICERQARSVWREHLAQDPLPPPTDYVALLAEELARIEAVIEDCAVLAETTANDAVRLGALKARAEATARRFEILQATGLVPRNLGFVRYEMEVTEIVGHIIRVFERHGVPDEAQDELVALLDGGARSSVVANGS